MKPRPSTIATIAIGLLFSMSLRSEEQKPALPPELAWLPADAVAFVHVRFGDLMRGPAGAAFREALNRDDPKTMERLEQTLGVRLTEIELLTLLVPETNGSGPEESVLLRVRTVEPYVRDRVLQRIFGADEAPKVKRRLSQIIELPNSAGIVYFAGERDLTFAFTRERTTAMLRRLEKPVTDGKLTPALKLAAEGHLLVAAIDVAQARKLSWIVNANDMRPFFIARSVVLVGDAVGTGFTFDLRLGVGLRVHGEEVAEALAARLVDAMKSVAAAQRDSTASAATKRMLDALATALGAVKIERKDREVAMSLSLPTADGPALLAADTFDSLNASGNRTISQNNLKQIGLAFHNCHDTYNHFAPAILDNKGKPLLSWRVHILPFIEETPLYQQFRLNEPWDSEHNKKLIAKMPKLYALPGDRKKHEMPSTYYRVFVGNGAMFDFKHKTTFARITDGLSNTIMAVEAAEPVIWTKPDEIEYDPNKPPKLGYHHAGRANVLYGDGSVATVRRTTDERTLHLLIQCADGNAVNRPD